MSTPHLPRTSLESPVSRRTVVLGAAATGALAGIAVTADRASAQSTSLPFASPVAGQQAGRRTLLLKDEFLPIAGWKRHGVIMSKDQPWETDLLQDPSIIYRSESGPVFKCWYGSLHGVGYATSSDGVEWAKLPTAVISPTLESEQGYLNQPSVVLQGGVWHMTYFGMNTSGRGQIHYASANSPEGPWTKRGVVLAPEFDWEDNFLYNSCLLYDARENVWKMWYTAGKIASAGGEPEFICYATASNPAGPWAKHPSNPLVRPMDDGGWASLGVGGPNVRILDDGSYESRIIGWQADHPSRAGRITSPDGLRWQLDRTGLDLDLGIVGGPEDSMIYRSFAVQHNGVDHLFYNVKNNRPGWNETINLAMWSNYQQIVDPAKWTMTHALNVPNGASFDVKDGTLRSLGNAPASSPQALQGNTLLRARDYSLTATVTPTGESSEARDTVLHLRATTRDRLYYAGISSWGNKYAIGVLEPGQNRKLAGVGSASDIVAGQAHRLRFEAEGSQLRLFDDDQLVVSVQDTTHQPTESYVGLQSSYGFGTAIFENVVVREVGTGGDAFAFQAKATPRCIAGKTIVAVVVTNNDDIPVTVTLRTPFGERRAIPLAPGKTASHTFSTRSASIAASTGTVIVEGKIDGATVVNEIALPIASNRC